MCTIHERQAEDLPVDFFEKFFMSPPLKQLRTINITGGEPTLRADLQELIAMVVTHCKGLKEIIISSNGLNPGRILQQIGSILDSLDTSLKLWVYISLDALDNRADSIRGIGDAAAKAMETLQGLKEMKKTYCNLQVGVSCIVVASNHNCLKEVYDYALGNNFYIDFVYATRNSAYINSEPNYEKFSLDVKQKNVVISFLKNITSFSKVGSTKLYYEKLIERLEGIQGNKECIFREGKGVLLEADGKIRICGMTEDSLLGDMHRNSVPDILSKCHPDLREHCRICETNSYYNWSKEAQEHIKEDMMEEIKKNIRNRRLIGGDQ